MTKSMNGNWPNRDPLGDFIRVQFTFPQTVNILLQARHMVPPNEALEDPNLYLFVYNAPVLKTDPFGLCPCDAGGCALAVGNCALASAVAALACGERNVNACRLAAAQAGLTCAAVPSACAGCVPSPGPYMPTTPPWGLH
jgi:hypothetical protein